MLCVTVAHQGGGRGVSCFPCILWRLVSKFESIFVVVRFFLIDQTGFLQLESPIPYLEAVRV